MVTGVLLSEVVVRLKGGDGGGAVHDCSCVIHACIGKFVGS